MQCHVFVRVIQLLMFVSVHAQRCVDSHQLQHALNDVQIAQDRTDVLLLLRLVEQVRHRVLDGVVGQNRRHC